MIHAVRLVDCKHNLNHSKVLDTRVGRLLHFQDFSHPQTLLRPSRLLVLVKSGFHITF